MLLWADVGEEHVGIGAPRRGARVLVLAFVVTLGLIAAACGNGTSQAVGTLGDVAATIAEPATPPAPSPTPLPATSPAAASPSVAPTVMPDPTATILPADTSLQSYFATIAAGEPLPSEADCAAAVRATPLGETHSQNAQANATPGGPSVRIDGADEFWNSVLSPRITGNFTGTTEELIRWVACKWGFDEDLTRARAWTESSWEVDTRGDQTSSAQDCALIGLDSPCFQSYGLLQVKGTVHEGTFPFAHRSSAWGLDYAMAWQRACFEGSFEWLIDDGYVANDLRGCVGAWFSGEWYDSLALGYLDDVDQNLARRPWN